MKTINDFVKNYPWRVKKLITNIPTSEKEKLKYGIEEIEIFESAQEEGYAEGLTNAEFIKQIKEEFTKIEDTFEVHRCPAGINLPTKFMIWKDNEELPDIWGYSGKDKRCSCCGSWHPKDFLEFVDQIVNKNTKGWLEFVSGKVKFYIHRPDAENKAIKFYGYHLEGYLIEIGYQHDSKEYHGVIDKINEAIKISHGIIRKNLNIPPNN